LVNHISHRLVVPAAIWPPAATTNGIPLKCTNHWSRRAARNGLNMSRLFTVAPPAATPLIATIAPITPSAAAIIAWGQATETA
jgi:hypothetical protein